jgi:simple sugar transport system permease protein
MNWLWRTVRSPLVSTALVLTLLFAYGCWRYEGFAKLFTFLKLLQDNSHLGIISVGVTFVILAGGIDLSVGAAIGLGTVMMAFLMAHGWSATTAVGSVILLLTAGGALQGLIVHGFAVPPFLITLGGMFLYRGAAQLITTEQIKVQSESFNALADWSYKLLVSSHLRPQPKLTVQVLLLVGMLVVAWLLLKLTRFGRNIYAVGGSEPSAVLMGLPVARTKVAVYAWSGLCAGIASLAALCGQTAGTASRGEGMELDAIAVVVIGGTLLTGGVGSVVGTLLGLLVYGEIQNIVNFQGTWQGAWTHIAVGALLLAFILLQQWLRSFGAAKKA